MIFGRDSNVSRTFLERARTLSRAIGRISTLSGPRGVQVLGTGFLISPRMAITCNHVLPTVDEAALAQMVLDYFAEADGSFAVPTTVRFAPHVFFATHEHLDITIVALDDDSARVLTETDRPHVELSSWLGEVIVGEPVSMIHHPLGEPQAFSLRGGVVLGLDDTFVRYDSPTQGGSAGAPVFDDNWRAIAVHRGSVPMQLTGGDPQSAPKYSNQGARIDNVIAWVDSLDVPVTWGGDVQHIGPSPAETAPVPTHREPPVVPSVAQDTAVVRDTVFISYAHEDQRRLRFHEELELHLRGVQSVGPLSVWQDGRIRAGTEWLPEIELALRRARVAVFLVGPHFLVSEFVQEKELPSLLEAAKTDGVRLFPFATHNIAYQESFLGRFQFYGDPERPLENLDRAARNKALVDLVRAVVRAFEEGT